MLTWSSDWTWTKEWVMTSRFDWLTYFRESILLLINYYVNEERHLEKTTYYLFSLDVSIYQELCPTLETGTLSITRLQKNLKIVNFTLEKKPKIVNFTLTNGKCSITSWKMSKCQLYKLANGNFSITRWKMKSANPNGQP